MSSNTCTLKNGSLKGCHQMNEALICSDFQINLIDQITEVVVLPRSEAMLNVCPFCGARILEVESNV